MVINQNIEDSNKFSKGDYVRYDYCGEVVTARINSITNDEANITVCLSNKPSEDNFFDSIDVKLHELTPLRVRRKPEPEA